MNAESRLLELGLALPPPPPKGGNYVAARTLHGLVYLSGVLSRDDQGAMITGTAGKDCGVEEGARAARSCVLLALSVLRAQLGSLDRVTAVASVTGYVHSTPEFGEMAAVMNGASDLLVEVFGDAGRHARTSIGVIALPRQALVEIQMVVAI